MNGVDFISEPTINSQLGKVAEELKLLHDPYIDAFLSTVMAFFLKTLPTTSNGKYFSFSYHPMEHSAKFIGFKENYQNIKK